MNVLKCRAVCLGSEQTPFRGTGTGQVIEGHGVLSTDQDHCHPGHRCGKHRQAGASLNPRTQGTALPPPLQRGAPPQLRATQALLKGQSRPSSCGLRCVTDGDTWRPGAPLPPGLSASAHGRGEESRGQLRWKDSHTLHCHTDTWRSRIQFICN